MTREELPFALELAAREGWNPGLSDAESFYAADPHGFFVGELDGHPIGCISGVSYAGVFGFIGLYIVVPEYRGLGYGIQLWRAAMSYLEGHNIGLDGVVEQQANYRKSGFRLAHRNIRFAGTAVPTAEMAELVPLCAVPLETLAAYDATVFPAPRPVFLESWRSTPGSTGVGAMNGGCLKGYGQIRPCREGYKVGPLFADAPATAASILNSLLRAVPVGALFYLDAPETNPAALALAEGRGMERVFETARMYTGTEPALAADRIFGITTFELG